MNTELKEPVKKSTMALVAEIKSNAEDFNWYPTTDAILAVIKDDIGEDNDHDSLMDIGAGDGRALQYLTKGSKYAIEKCQTLIKAMDRNIYIVGTEFQEQTLIDKSVKIIFSNPPFEFWNTWANKIIREGNCTTLYLILPRRWAKSEDIKACLKLRKATTKVLGSFDFTKADRAARAKVDIIRVNLGYEERYSHNSGPRVDPFELWFDTEFSIQINNRSSSRYEWSKQEEKKQKEAIEKELISGGDIVKILEKLYLVELDKLMQNYKSLETLDPGLLIELDVNLVGLKEALQQKVEGLKDRYWKELFNNLDKITSRLTTGARERMLSKLTQHTHVDFTAANCYSVILWVLKNANQYYDDQLIELVERMTESASIVLYKSNMRTFQMDDWRYSRTPEKLDRYSLDHRIVLHRVGGLSRSSSSWDQERYRGLSQRSYELLQDILTVANNLNFTTKGCIGLTDTTWESNKAIELKYYDPVKEETEVLLKIRAYYNGNMHLALNQSFIRKLNVEFGRLKGWLRDKNEAAEELNIDIEEVGDAFGSNLQITGNNLLALCFDATP